MNYVSAENLTKSYGVKVLFQNIISTLMKETKLPSLPKTEAENHTSENPDGKRNCR
jgi:hypothetical protein